MANPLDIIGDLELLIDDERVDIRGDGRRVVVDVPSLAVARKMVLSTPYRGSAPDTANYVNDALREVDLTLDVMLNHRRVVRLGADAQPNAASRFLNIPAVEVHPSVPARETASRNPIATALLFITGIGLLLWLLRADEED